MHAAMAAPHAIIISCTPALPSGAWPFEADQTDLQRAYLLHDQPEAACGWYKQMMMHQSSS